MVPVNVISHFLENVNRYKSFEGVCGLGAKLQGMENEDLRSHFYMKDSDTGFALFIVECDLCQ